MSLKRAAKIPVLRERETENDDDYVDGFCALAVGDDISLWHVETHIVPSLPLSHPFPTQKYQPNTDLFHALSLSIVHSSGTTLGLSLF